MNKPGVVAHACHPNIQEAEAGESQIWGHPGLHSMLESSLEYILRSYIKH
jgi:hypothetical protein